MRLVTPLALPASLTPATIDGPRPRVVDLDPAVLRIDDRYQRGLSERSTRLIRKIVAGWDWRKFKPPIAVETPDGYDLLDGQHTAIAALSHGSIGTIPVMVVDAESVAQRADAFLGLNLDRVGMTQMAIHRARVAAGEEDALTLDSVCRRAGIRLLSTPPRDGNYEVGDCMAFTALRRLLARRSVQKARQTLQTLVDAQCAPISADLIKAADTLLWEPSYAGLFKPETLTQRLLSTPIDDSEVFTMAQVRRIPRWQALAIVLAKSPRKGGR